MRDIASTESNVAQPSTASLKPYEARILVMFPDDRALRAADILFAASNLGMPCSPHTVSVALPSLARRGLLVRVGPGAYALPGADSTRRQTIMAWVWAEMRERPSHAVSVRELARLYLSRKGMKMPAELFRLALDQLDRGRLVDEFKPGWYVLTGKGAQPPNPFD